MDDGKAEVRKKRGNPVLPSSNQREKKGDRREGAEREKRDAREGGLRGVIVFLLKGLFHRV